MSRVLPGAADSTAIVRTPRDPRGRARRRIPRTLQLRGGIARPGCLDMLQNALREYDSVSSDSTAAAGAVASTDSRLAVDVRQFPWARPLSGDYAFNFSAVASLYAGDPQSP